MILTKKQQAKFIKWKKKHDEGVYKFTFTPTSKGMIATVTNVLTKESLDL